MWAGQASLLCAASCWLAAQPVALDRIRQRGAEDIARLANYKCTEAVERERRPSAEGAAETRDALRLDVAYIGGSEIYSWPDGTPFEEGALERLMSGGTIFNGLFASFAKTALASPDVFLRFAGIDEARQLRFLYELAPKASGFAVSIGRERAVVGYRGSVTIDPATLDLTRLEVLGDAVPPELGLHSIRMTVDYGRTAVGAERPLLPGRADVEVRYAAGPLSRARVTFENCRRYAAESRVSFEDPAGVPVAAAGARPLERAVRLEAALDGTLDLDRCAAGDAVRAVLTRAAVAGKERIADAGAAVDGRVERVERRLSPAPHVLLAVRFHSLAGAGGAVRFRGRVEGIRTTERSVRAQALRPGRSEYRLTRTYGRFTGFAEAPDTGLLVIEGSSRLPRGTELQLLGEPEPEAARAR